MNEFDLQVVAVVTHRLESALESRDVTVMVGAEQINQVIEAALTLVVVICNIRCEIGFGAILSNDNTVFVIAEAGRRKPGCAILFVQYATFFEHAKRVVDAIAFRQLLLRIPAIESDAELGKVIFDVLADRLQ